jgi:glutathione peroxidase
MKKKIFFLLPAVIIIASLLTINSGKGETVANSIYDFTVKDINGKEVSLSEYKDKVVLVVNVASKCGYTPQYEGLEKIYNQFKDKGFVILAFPCNQFGAQEPGTNNEIKEFCSANYKVTFPLFDKIDVNGDNASPLYQYLTSSKPGIMGTKAIKWNFTKFLIGKDGKAIERYGSSATPEQIAEDIKKIL